MLNGGVQVEGKGGVRVNTTFLSDVNVTTRINVKFAQHSGMVSIGRLVRWLLQASPRIRSSISPLDLI
mgnify:CR=1 FL=1